MSTFDIPIPPGAGVQLFAYRGEVVTVPEGAPFPRGYHTMRTRRVAWTIRPGEWSLGWMTGAFREEAKGDEAEARAWVAAEDDQSECPDDPEHACRLCSWDAVPQVGHA